MRQRRKEIEAPAPGRCRRLRDFLSSGRVQVASFLLGCALLIALIGLLLWRSEGTQNFSMTLEVSKGLMSLVTALLITGGVSYALSRRTQRRAEGIARLSFLSESLQELKAAHEQMAVARTFLRANRTARTFEHQLPQILAARAQLQRIERNVPTFESKDLADALQEMVVFTRDVADYYEYYYPTIAQQALQEEAERERFKQEGGTLTPQPLLDLRPAKADFLRKLVSEDEEWDKEAFQKGYRNAKDALDWLIKKARHDAR